MRDDLCPICRVKGAKLLRTLFDGTAVCRSCFNSPEYKGCTVCMEVYPIKMLASVKPAICTGCSVRKAVAK